MITCQNCGVARPIGTQFCPNCGSPSVSGIAPTPVGSSATKKISLATIILSGIGVFLLAIGQYGGSSWEWNGLTPNHSFYGLARIAYLSAALGFLLLVIGWAISLKPIVARIGVTAYIFAAIGFFVPIVVEVLYAIQIKWVGQRYSATYVWEHNWFNGVLMLSYACLAVAVLVGGLVARSRSNL